MCKINIYIFSENDIQTLRFIDIGLVLLRLSGFPSSSESESESVELSLASS